MFKPLAVTGVFTVLIATAVASPIGPAAGAATGFCAQQASYTGTTIKWTGDGDGKYWTDPDNWSTSQVPDAGQGTS